MNTYYKIYKTYLKQELDLLCPTEIKAIRKFYHLKQTEFAELLGISYHTYKNWEIGHRIPCTPSNAMLHFAKDYPDIFLKKRKHLLKNLKTVLSS